MSNERLTEDKWREIAVDIAHAARKREVPELGTPFDEIQQGNPSELPSEKLHSTFHGFSKVSLALRNVDRHRITGVAIVSAVRRQKSTSK